MYKIVYKTKYGWDEITYKGKVPYFYTHRDASNWRLINLGIDSIHWTKIVEVNRAFMKKVKGGVAYTGEWKGKIIGKKLPVQRKLR